MGDYRQGERRPGERRDIDSGAAPSDAMARRTRSISDSLGTALDGSPRVQSLVELRSSLDARLRSVSEASPPRTGDDDTGAMSRVHPQGRAKPSLHAKTGAVEQIGKLPAGVPTQRVASQGAAPVLQRQIILAPEFEANATLKKAYERIGVVLAQDPVLGELYEHAKQNKSNLVFKVGNLSSEAGVGLTELFRGNTKITAENAVQILGADTKEALFETHITIDYARIAELLKSGADKDAKNPQPTDVLQILAHEYGVHATKNLAFLKQLKGQQGTAARSAYVAGAFASSGSMSGGTHHEAHLKKEAVDYNKLSTALRTKLPESAKLGPAELDSFLKSEGADREMIKIVLEKLKPAMENAKELAKRAEGLTDGPVKFGKKEPSGSSCFITTACTQARGLPDDCEELTVLRAFRDRVLCRFVEGRELCSHYYRISPEIVQAIARSGREAAIYERLYGTIRGCVDAIQRGDERWAFQTYVGMVLLLMQRYSTSVPSL